MKKTNSPSMTNDQLVVTNHKKGVALIVVIIVLAFLSSVSFVLLTVTGIGPKVAGNMRSYQQAFNAAEAGFDTAWTTIEGYFSDGMWAHFDGKYLTQPVGIGNPQSDNYFRKLTDQELLSLIDPDEDGTPDVSTVIFCRQPYIQTQDGSLDPRYTYTVFLIDDEAGGGIPNSNDALLVCIGSDRTGSNITTSRLEVGLAVELQGSN